MFYGNVSYFKREVRASTLLAFNMFASVLADRVATALACQFLSPGKDAFVHGRVNYKKLRVAVKRAVSGFLTEHDLKMSSEALDNRCIGVVDHLLYHIPEVASGAVGTAASCECAEPCVACEHKPEMPSELFDLTWADGTEPNS